jgi:hypothetical protein
VTGVQTCALPILQVFHGFLLSQGRLGTAISPTRVSFKILTYSVNMIRDTAVGTEISYRL